MKIQILVSHSYDLFDWSNLFAHLHTHVDLGIFCFNFPNNGVVTSVKLNLPVTAHQILEKFWNRKLKYVSMLVGASHWQLMKI